MFAHLPMFWRSIIFIAFTLPAAGFAVGMLITAIRNLRYGEPIEPKRHWTTRLLFFVVQALAMYWAWLVTVESSEPSSPPGAVFLFGYLVGVYLIYCVERTIKFIQWLRRRKRKGIVPPRQFERNSIAFGTQQHFRSHQRVGRRGVWAR